MVGAGEQSGASGRLLERLADDLEQRQALRSKVMGAMLYPTIVSAVALIIVIVLVTFVVPQIATVFTSSKRALPLLTMMMLGFSAFVRQWGWLVAGAGWRRHGAGPGRRTRPSANASMRLAAPAFVGRLARGYNAARFGGTLAMLAGAGVPILKALQAAAETLGNRAMRADAMDALVQVREGAPLATALAGKKRFPGLLAMFARLGEQTGQFPTMLRAPPPSCRPRCSAARWRRPRMLEPLLIVAMGVIVMLIVLAVLMPIIQLNTWVK